MITSVKKNKKNRSARRAGANNKPVTVRVTEQVLTSPIVPKIRKNRAQKKINKKQKKRNFVESVKKELSLIAKEVEPPALTGTKFRLPVNIQALYYMIMALNEHISMKTNFFMETEPGVYLCTPGEMALYLFVCLLCHIDRLGNLTGTLISQIPRNTKFIVPSLYGKWLQGYSNYIEDGCECISTFDFETSYVPAQNYPDTSAGTFPFLSGQPATQQPIRSIRSMTREITTGMSEFTLTPDALTGLSFVQFVATRMNTISTNMAQLRISTMNLTDVSLKAPNGSRYALPSFPVNANASTNCWRSLVRNVINDEALLYVGTGASNAGTMLFPTSFMIPYHLMPHATTNQDPVEDYFNVFVLCWLYAKYITGPILKNSKYCKLRVNGFMYQAVTIDATVLPRILSNAYRQVAIAANTLTFTGVGDTNLQMLRACQSLATMLVLNRYNQNCINYHYYDNFSAIQQYYCTSEYHSIPLPALAAGALADLGPINMKGMIVAPVFNTILGSLNNVPNSPWIPISNGITASVAQGSVFSWELNCAKLATPVGDDISFDNVTVGPAILAALSLSFVGGGLHVYGINNQLHNLNGLWSSVYTRFTTGSNFTSELVHQHPTVCGSINMLAMNIVADDLLNDNYNEAFYPAADTSGISYLPFRGYRSLKATYCPVQLSSIQLLRNMATLWVSTNNTFVIAPQNSKFEVIYQSQYNVNEFQYQALALTFNTGTTFSKALGIAQNKFKGGYARYGSMELVKLAVHDCFWNGLFNDALKTLSPVLRKGVGLAAGELCGPYCSVGGQVLYDWLYANIALETNEVVDPVTSKKPEELEKALKQLSGFIPKVNTAKFKF